MPRTHDCRVASNERLSRIRQERTKDVTTTETLVVKFVQGPKEDDRLKVIDRTSVSATSDPGVGQVSWATPSWNVPQVIKLAVIRARAEALPAGGER